MNLIYIILITIGIATVGIGAWTVIGGMMKAYREICAHRRVEARFLKIWDKTKTNELLAWTKLRRQLELEHAPRAERMAAKKRITMCKQRHRSYRQVRLQNGRTVIVSTLN